MANKKINELSTRTPSLTDLLLVGDPSSGYSYKATVTALADIIETDIGDAFVTLSTSQTISGAKTFSNTITATSVANSPTDTDKFLVLNASNVINYRTGAEVLSDIGGQGALTLTTTGSSGASTLVSNTLNIPTYTLSGLGGVPSTRQLTINGTAYDLSADRTWSVGTVTSVALSVPTGLSITGSPITSSGTLAISLQSGYSIPTTASQANWDAAYNDKINSAAVTGTTTKTLTLTQQDGGTVTASWTDDNTDAVTSVFGRTGVVVATEGDYSLTLLSDVTITSPTTGQVLKYNGTTWVNDTDANTGTVTSVALSAPTGFSVSGSPVTSSGTLTLSFASGYSLPTTASQTNWDTAYTNRITSLTTTGNSGSATLVSNTLNIPTYTLAGLGGISLTSLSALAPLSYNNTTGAFSISQATTSTDGYLSSTDWNTFNNKQATITLTTIGSSGSATFASNTLNIPTYTLSGLGGEPAITAGTTSQYFRGDKTFQTLNTAAVTESTNLYYTNARARASISLTTTGTSGAATYDNSTGVLNIPQYSGGSGTVSGTINYVAKFTSSTVVGNSSIFDDGTNVGISTTTAGSKLQINGSAAIGYSASTAAPSNGLVVSGNVGIGTASPSQVLNVNGNVLFEGSVQGNLIIQKTGTGGISIYSNAAGTLGFYDQSALTDRMRLNSSGNFGIGTTTIGSRLQVNGNAAIGYSASTAAPTNGLAVAGNIQAGSTTAGAQINVFSSSYGSNGLFNAYGTDGAIKLQMGGLASTQAYIYTPASVDLLLFTGAAEKARLTSSGEFQLKPAANTAALSTSASYSLTGSNAQSLLDLAGTWNTTGNPTAIKLNITNTASGATSRLMDLQIGGVSQFTVTKGGAIQTSAPSGGTAKPWKFGEAGVTLGGSNTSGVRVEIDGTVYYLVTGYLP